MRVIGIEKIHDFMLKHADTEEWFKAWIAEAKSMDWQSPNDIKRRYKSASILDKERIVLNVKGNNYRMEIQVSYKNKVVAIKRIGTHAEYSRWDK